ncbi:ADP compounds hydrolase NudE [Pasteurella multocida]|uniref:Hydrolase, NUDIX family n=1 Tax=Pasteurella dagmatis ATCC 43325 TaxID=667128 RepID=C9PPB7_9PAST|nr:ADP compounds hydrolase NudE [Pasteurella dagmatis]EEX50615.1 hydrolase, NUDIX family [Pasteurella dagmatis ATCC 43325]SNV80503.1 ADP compounds hydrolase NudE [Pasteurella dagmatis]VEI58680.1 ADP compounds hydrolase NudE [Pasteurella multocida]
MQKPEILSVSVAAKSQIFEIQSVKLRFSNGEYRTYERFKPSSRAAVMVLPIEGNELLMVREYAVGTERYELGFPKGLMDPNETPEQSAVRELKEEIGLGANSLQHLRTVNTSPSHMNNPMHIFIARDFYPCKLEGDEPEPLELVRFPLDKIDELLVDANFCEARNLVALYCLRDFLYKNF